MNLAKLRKFTVKDNKYDPWSKLMSDGNWIYATDRAICIRTSHKPDRVKAKPVGDIENQKFWKQIKTTGPYFRPILHHGNKSFPDVIEIIPGILLDPHYIRLLSIIKDITIAPAIAIRGVRFISTAEKCEGLLAGCQENPNI